MYKIVRNGILAAASIMILAAIFMLVSDGMLRTQEKESQEDQRENIPETETGRKTEFSMTGSLPETLPEEARLAVEAINAGCPLAEATGLEELNGYYALTGANTVIATDPESGETSTEGGVLKLYVPNLLEGLQNVSILFCGSTDGCWQIIPAEETDPQGKRVTVTLPGPGVVTTIYRKE